jgi:hypothetical protein
LFVHSLKAIFWEKISLDEVKDISGEKDLARFRRQYSKLMPAFAYSLITVNAFSPSCPSFVTEIV